MVFFLHVIVIVNKLDFFFFFPKDLSCKSWFLLDTMHRTGGATMFICVKY